MLNPQLHTLDKPSPAPTFQLLESVILNGNVQRIMGYIYHNNQWRYWTSATNIYWTDKYIQSNIYRKIFAPAKLKFKYQLGAYVLWEERVRKIIGMRYFDGNWFYCVQAAVDDWYFVEEKELKGLL